MDLTWGSKFRASASEECVEVKDVKLGSEQKPTAVGHWVEGGEPLAEP